MSSTFLDLGVPKPIVKALAARGITEPFEIQASTITDALAGRDVCGRAPTGSGKTLAFGIPLVARATRARPGAPTALVLAPTRELAEQIHGELRSFAGGVRVEAVYGGVGYGRQQRALRRGVDVLVACPGRLEDLIDRGDVRLGSIDQVVLDEADRMADMGFVPAVKRLLDQTPADRQTTLFSATLDGDVAVLTKRYQRNPVRHEVGDTTPDITSARHVFWRVDKPDRAALAAEAIGAAWPAIVFCRTRHGSDRLAKNLARAGIEAAAIHGGRSQNQRNRALDAFTRGKVHALVATDVAARGIHVDDVAAVFHFDPPEDHKTYIHRSGRTARAGKGGVVVSLLQPEQVGQAKGMQRRLGIREAVTAPDVSALHDGAPPRRVPAEPRSERGNGAGTETTPAQGRRRSNRRKRKPRQEAARDQQQQPLIGPKRPNRKARRAHLQPSASKR